MLKTEAIKEFLLASGNKHLTSHYSSEMEVQVNVTQGKGKKKGGTYAGKRWTGWTDGNETWKSFRIPWNANTDPDYVDKTLYFDLAKHVDGIGMTGWNWAKQQSEWVGFDFDSIANHKQGLDEDELEDIKKSVLRIPWIHLIKSTSGKGFHIYIYLGTPVPTRNHTEHAALARSILTVLSSDTGFNLNASVDACGTVLWCYHRKQEGTDGLSLIREGDSFPLEKIPSNWKDHIDVTNKKRRRIKSISDNEVKFDELVSSLKVQTLDDEHRVLLKWFSEKADRDNWWDSDHNMLVCHTFDLKKAHTDLSLRGIFDTSSSGSSPQNCYAFPVSSGAWVVRRHSLNVNEHVSWITDPTGWTRCVYNDIAEFNVCARANSGIENSKGEYVFQTVKQGLKALHDMDLRGVEISDQYSNRPMTVKEKPDGKIIISFTRESADPSLDDFLSNAKGDRWERVIHRTKKKREVYAPDFLIRHIISNEAEAGWWIHTRKKWIQQNKSNVTTVLLSQQEVRNKQDTELYMSKAILNPWELVNIPFEDVYPGNREWNKNAAALSCKAEEGLHPTWNSILDHCGTALNSAVSENQWCVDNAISSGSDYLLCWIASLFQKPADPLPYLFFMGEQNTGKSTLHEALSMLFKNNRGYCRADNALINQQGFNSEISNAVLCVVEETDLKRNKDASNRIKDWVTGRTISINTKYKVVFDITNTTHWIQCANDPAHCPILPGDTRIVVVKVDPPKKEIPKQKLFDMLEDEKSYFLNSILTLELPEPEGRLAVPCLQSNEKRMLENSNMNDLEQFLVDETTPCYGALVPFDEMMFAFSEWLPVEKRGTWTKQKVAHNFPKKHPYVKGKYGSDNTTYVANITFDWSKKPEAYEYVLNEKNRLERKNLNV